MPSHQTKINISHENIEQAQENGGVASGNLFITDSEFMSHSARKTENNML